MGSEKLTIRDLLRAGFDGAIEAGKTTPILAFILGSLDSLRKQCGELDRETLVDLSLQAKKMEIDDIRKALGDLFADQAEVRREVESLAKSFVTYIATHETIPLSLEELLSGQQTIREVVIRTEATVQRIEEKIDVLSEGGPTVVTQTHLEMSGPSDSGHFHGDIDTAVQHLKRCEPDAVLVLLRRLEKRHWPELTDRERYRVKANMGHAHRLNGKDDRAADLFLQAHSYQSEDASAIALAARAYSIKDDKKHAREFAEKAFAKDANCSLAVAVYLETRPEGTSLKDLEADVPDSLLSDSEVCCELVLRALRQKCFSKGEEYARRSIQANSEEYSLYFLLGTVLLDAELKRWNATGGSDLNTERLREAINAFDDAESHSKLLRRDRDRTMLLVNRGAARALLAEDDAAETDLRTALQLAPEDPDVVYNLAHLQCRNDNDDASQSLTTLSSIPPSDRSKRCVFLVLDVALKTEDPKLMRQAWDEALEARIPWGEVDLWDRVTYLSLMSLNRAMLGEPEKGLEFLRGEVGGGVPAFYQHLLAAQVHLTSGGVSQAKPLLLKALETFDDTVDRRIVISLGRNLHEVGLAEEAWVVLKDEISTGRITEEAGLLMNCALAAGRHEFVMAFCADLRRHGAFDERFIEVELYEYASYHSLQQCISICQETLQQDTISHRFRRHMRMRLSSFAVLLKREELIERNAGNLPNIDEIQPEWAPAMVQALLETTTPEKALDCGYTLFRRYPDDVQTWHAVIASSGMMSGHQVPARRVDCVGPDAAVRYRDEDTGEERWCIIETLENPQSQLDELAPDHPLAKAMEGKKVDETFDLPGPARTGTILEVIDKRAYRFRYCADRIADRHPEEANIWTIRADGEDRIEGLVHRMLEKATERRRHGESILAVYRKTGLPLGFVASGLGKTCFEMTMSFTEASTDIPLCFAWGNGEEKEHCSQWLGASPRLVVDATAFASIVNLGLWKKLEEWSVDLVTTEATREQLELFVDPRFHSEETMLSVSDSSGEDRLAFLPSDSENLRKNEVGRFLTDADGRIEVAGGHALARLNPQPSDDLEKLIGRDTLASFAVAQEQEGVFWIDDRFAARVITETWPEARTVNTQAILTSLQEDGLLDQSGYYDLLLQMLVRGYSHVLLDTNGFRHAIDATNGDLRDLRLEAVFGLLGDSNVLPLSVVRLALQSIKNVWQCGFLSLKAESLTMHILDRVISRPDGRNLVQQIVRQVESVFSFDLVNAPQALGACERWLSRQVL